MNREEKRSCKISEVWLTSLGFLPRFSSSIRFSIFSWKQIAALAPSCVATTSPKPRSVTSRTERRFDSAILLRPYTLRCLNGAAPQITGGKWQRYLAWKAWIVARKRHFVNLLSWYDSNSMKITFFSSPIKIPCNFYVKCVNCRLSWIITRKQHTF